jgi:ABC-type branched-subunit amino acid transport system ATPase component
MISCLGALRSTGAEAMLEAQRLTKRYGGTLALDKVNFRVIVAR